MKISFGNKWPESNKQPGELVTLDLEKEDMHFVLLVGEEGAGKSFFQQHIYKELIEGRLPHDIAFLFLGMPEAEAMTWGHSPYLYDIPIAADPEKELRVLEALAADKSRQRVRLPTDQTVIVHIEGSDLIKLDRERLENALAMLLLHRKTNGVYIFYSMSEVSRSLLTVWLEHFVDLLVVFKISDEGDARFLTGETHPLHFISPGEHLLVYGEERIHCAPFPPKTQIL